MSTSIIFGAAQRDKLQMECVAALCLAGTPGFSGDIHVPGCGTQPVKKPENVRPSAEGVARALLYEHGCDFRAVMNLQGDTLARVVFGDRHAWEHGMGRYDMALASNVTGMYQGLLTDAANVQLRKAYFDARTTYQDWAIKGEPIKDYRDASIVGVGVFPDPQAVGEDGELVEVGTVDTKEKWRLVEWGQRAFFSFKLLINDSLGGLIGTRVRKMANALARLENRLVYRQLKENLALSDGVALFHADHGNENTGVVSSYGTVTGTMTKKMVEQRAPGEGSAALGIVPAHIIYPPALDDPIRTLLNSTAAPDGPHSGVANVARGKFNPVMEPELAAAFGGSDTAFYLAGDGIQEEHIMYAFMEGRPEPTIRDFTRPGVLGLGTMMHHAFATKAVGYRSLQRATGV